MYLHPSQAAKMNLFMEIVLSEFWLLNSSAESSILDVLLILNTLLGSSIFIMNKRFAVALMAKSSNRLNCQNDMCSQGMQVRCFFPC